MRKWIVIILGLVGLVVIGIVVLRLLSGSKNATFKERSERIGCNYPGELMSIDEEKGYFVIKYNKECSLCHCNEEGGLDCHIVLCPAEQKELDEE